MKGGAMEGVMKALDGVAERLKLGDRGMLVRLGLAFARHRRYSTRNRLFIFAQRPYARAVRSAKGWKGAGREVRPSAKPIRIVMHENGRFVEEEVFELDDTRVVSEKPRPVVPETFDYRLLGRTPEEAAKAILRAFPGDDLETVIARASAAAAFGLVARMPLSARPPRDGRDLFFSALKGYKRAEEFLGAALEAEAA